MPWLLAALLGFSSGSTDGGAESAPTFAPAMTRPVPLTPIDWTYPDEARANNPRGLIILKCVIDVQGVIEDCEVLRSLPGVTDWALRKLKAARFRPVTADGKPVRVSYVFSIFLRPDGESAPRPDNVPARWRPTPSPELLSTCTGPNAAVCRDAALSFLWPDAGPPDYERAGRVLTAACMGGLQDACTRLDTSFLPPRLISGVPPGPVTSFGEAEGMVTCRITVEERARKCQGSAGPGSDWFIAQMLEAKFLPASFKGTPFETEHAVRYSFRNRR